MFFSIVFRDILPNFAKHKSTCYEKVFICAFGDDISESSVLTKR